MFWRMNHRQRKNQSQCQEGKHQVVDKEKATQPVNGIRGLVIIRITDGAYFFLAMILRKMTTPTGIRRRVRELKDPDPSKELEP